MSDFYGKVGFASPASASTVIKRRAGVELIATLGLAVCLVIAMTAVSIGVAHAQVLRAVGENSHTSLAIAALFALAMAGRRARGASATIAARSRVRSQDRP